MTHAAEGSTGFQLEHQLRNGPATYDVPEAAQMLGVSKAGLYAAIGDGTAPVRTIKVGKRIKVLTSSLLEVLGGVRLGDTGAHHGRSEPALQTATTSAVKWQSGGDAA